MKPSFDDALTNYAKNYCNRTLIVQVSRKCSHMFFFLGHSVFVSHVHSSLSAIVIRQYYIIYECQIDAVINVLMHN